MLMMRMLRRACSTSRGGSQQGLCTAFIWARCRPSLSPGASWLCKAPSACESLLCAFDQTCGHSCGFSGYASLPAIYLPAQFDQRIAREVVAFQKGVLSVSSSRLARCAQRAENAATAGASCGSASGGGTGTGCRRGLPGGAPARPRCAGGVPSSRGPAPGTPAGSCTLSCPLGWHTQSTSTP